jgi:hypothetical protein
MLISICESPFPYRDNAVGREGQRLRAWGLENSTDDGRMAYIDSELAKRRDAEAHLLSETQQQASRPTTSTTLNTGREGDKQEKKEADVQRQPATFGKLQEIDLGDEARDRNVAETERARRRLDGEAVEEESDKKPVKVRLGPDGKPWRGRRKRRGSEDVKRDQLVEDVLRENRRKHPVPPSYLSPQDFLYPVSKNQQKLTSV